MTAWEAIESLICAVLVTAAIWTIVWPPEQSHRPRRGSK